MTPENDQATEQDKRDSLAEGAEFDIILYTPHVPDSFAAAQLAAELCPESQVVEFEQGDSMDHLAKCHNQCVMAIGLGPVAEVEEIESIEAQSARFVGLDPQYSAAPYNLDDHPACIVDPGSDGSCVMTVWHYLVGDDEDVKMPAIYKYSAQAMMPLALQTLPHVSHVWMALATTAQRDPTWQFLRKNFRPLELSAQGMGIERYNKLLRRKLCSEATVVPIFGEKVPVVQTSVLRMEVAKALAANDAEFAATFEVDYESSEVTYTLVRGNLSRKDFRSRLDHFADVVFYGPNMATVTTAAKFPFDDIHEAAYLSQADLWNIQSRQNRLVVSDADTDRPSDEEVEAGTKIAVVGDDGFTD